MKKRIRTQKIVESAAPPTWKPQPLEHEREDRFFDPRDAMLFKIDDDVRIVVVAAGRLWNQGSPCMGVCSFCSPHIFLAPELPLAMRRRTLWHELRHAWLCKFPPRRMATEDEDPHFEADANSVSQFVDALLPQYVAQGGDDRLASLRPARIIDSKRSRLLMAFNCTIDFNPIPDGEVAVG